MRPIGKIHYNSTDKCTKAIIFELDDTKAVDITELDIRPLTDIADTMLIATATSTRHAKALADKAIDKGKEIDMPPYSKDGYDSCEWILVDFGDLIVNIMLAETREFYALEKLWCNIDEQD